MRPVLYVAAAIALAATVPPEAVSSVLASSASVLLEASPFLALGSLATFLGCGCGRAGARAFPVVALGCIVFGPAVAFARCAAALVAARWLAHSHHEAAARTTLDELRALVPSAVLAAIVLHVVDTNALPRSAALQAALGSLVGFLTPCALGGVATAGALHARDPFAAAAVLCISGIVDVRTFFARVRKPSEPNGLGEALLACACALVAARHGAQLVHPMLSMPLALACVVFAWRALRTPWRSPGRESLAPAIALAALVIGAPAPVYRATETTLAGSFPGERVHFTGALVRVHGEAALVRYAITCCRADAQPVVLQLASAPPYAERTWLRVDGTLVRRHARLALVASSLAAVAPPTDPFVYR
jgi:hypothetical protein